jgi:hypothetical protein
MRSTRWLAAAAAVLAVATIAPINGDSDQTARPLASIPSVGPLFHAGDLGLGAAFGLPHYCTADVVHSASRDLVLTAAHCITGDGVGIEFAPGYHDGVAPYGSWRVERVYVDARWRQTHDPRYDVAVLRMASRGLVRVEDRTGAAPLGSPPPTGASVTVDGYVAGPEGHPLTCTSSLYYTQIYPSFDCSGYEGGVSGGRWVAGGRIVGVTGGLHQGGCSPDSSYSAPFGPDIAALVARAEAGGPGDDAVPAADDDC